MYTSNIQPPCVFALLFSPTGNGFQTKYLIFTRWKDFRDCKAVPKRNKHLLINFSKVQQLNENVCLKASFGVKILSIVGKNMFQRCRLKCAKRQFFGITLAWRWMKLHPNVILLYHLYDPQKWVVESPVLFIPVTYGLKSKIWWLEWN